MHTVSYTGKILFEPENKTKKHLAQASWKKVAMVIFEGDIAEYYSWFLERRFGIELNKPLRGAHVTFINDSMNDLNAANGSEEKSEKAWEDLKAKWDGKEIDVTLNLRPFSDDNHWWLIVDHNHRQGLHNIRAEIGLEKPYFGLHLTMGYVNERNLDHSKYINMLNEKGFTEINKDYGK